MEALIVLVVMHCGVPEVIIVDDPVRVQWDEVDKDERTRAMEFVERARASGARVVTIEVKDAKCATST